ncbi:hypothetical protein BDZ89DRAFT_1061855 [Hymenopellis radicata]|nr:hypothetical protein BDZ89DRAFT_1061855 [Hymenopellis radicata]
MLSLPLELILVFIEELWQIDSRQYRQCASSGLNVLYPADRVPQSQLDCGRRRPGPRRTPVRPTCQTPAYYAASPSFDDPALRR